MIRPEYENKNFKQDVLVYVGEGLKVEGIPMHSLDAAECEKYGGVDYLVSTGLWVYPDDIVYDGG